MTHLERLQCAIITSVAFHPDLCWNLEDNCNLWMGQWDCWLGFRFDQNTETILSRLYTLWFMGSLRANVSLTTNIHTLYYNLLILETLSVELQQEIVNNATKYGFISTEFPQLLQLPDPPQLSKVPAN